MDLEIRRGVTDIFVNHRAGEIMMHLKLYHLLFGLENWFTFSNNFKQILG